MWQPQVVGGELQLDGPCGTAAALCPAGQAGGEPERQRYHDGDCCQDGSGRERSTTCPDPVVALVQALDQPGRDLDIGHIAPYRLAQARIEPLGDHVAAPLWPFSAWRRDTVAATGAACGARLSRSRPMARQVVFFTVPSEQPSRAAVSASDRSCQ